MQLFARGGYSVCLYDISLDQLQGARQSIAEQLKSLEGEGLLRNGQTAESLLPSVSYSDNLAEAVKDVIYIQVGCVYVHAFLHIGCIC